MFNNNLFNSAHDIHSNDSSKIAQNPFKQEEVLQAWLESDLDYNKAKLRAKKTLQPNKSQFFMSIKDSYISFINLITKNAIVATLLMLVSAGAVSASALQTFAPEEFKPSTIIQKTFNPKDFAVNTVQEKNPYSPLNWDENNSVVFVDACDLAIKYPVKFNNLDVTVFRDSQQSESTGTFDYVSVIPDYATQQKSNETVTPSYIWPTISCYSQKPEGIDTIGKYGTEIKNAGPEFIKQNFGWFITQAEIKNVKVFENPNIPKDYNIYFEFNNKHYLIGVQTENSKIDNSNLISLTGKLIQVQFISLVKSQANKVVVDGTGKVIDEKTISDSTKAIIVEPKNASLEKSSNSIPYVTDGYGQNGICGIFGVTSYKFPGDADGGYMKVTSSKLNLDDMQKKSFNRFNDFLDGKVGYNPDFANGINYLEQFSSYCSGIAAYTSFIEAPQIAYPKTDKVKVVYSLAGQAEITGPVVLVFASKGDNQILLEDYISEIKYPQIPAAIKCGYNVEDSGKSNFNRDCYENILKNDPKLKEIMDQSAKDLIKTFELK